MDLVIRGGTVVTVGGRAVTDVGIDAGKIVQLGGKLKGATELDATDLFVTPGGVDPHVHLTPPTRDPDGWRWVDNFESGTRAALAGGVTTVGNISFPAVGETLADAVEHDSAEADGLSLADYFLHPVLMEPNEANLATIAPLHAAGHTSIKSLPVIQPFRSPRADYLDAMRRVVDAGGIAADALRRRRDHRLLLQSAARGGQNRCALLSRFARPLQAEVVATQRAVGFAETTGCPTYIVHLASDSALKACHDGRSRGVPVYVETRPLYLHLTRERFDEPDGAKYAGAPPLREPVDVNAMWAGLKFGHIDTLATDHAPWMLADKLETQDLADLRQGVADLETCLPMLFSSGVLSGRVTLEQFVAVTSTNPAKLFGLYPNKGTIEVGADADLNVWDHRHTRTIDGAAMHSLSDFSPYDGWEVTGWPRWTVSHGKVVVDRGTVIAEPGDGRLARRRSHRPI